MVFNEYDVYMTSSSNKDGLLYNETRRVFTDASDGIHDVVYKQVKTELDFAVWINVYNNVWTPVRRQMPSDILKRIYEQ